MVKESLKNVEDPKITSRRSNHIVQVTLAGSGYLPVFTGLDYNLSFSKKGSIRLEVSETQTALVDVMCLSHPVIANQNHKKESQLYRKRLRIKNLAICTYHSDSSPLPGVFSSRFFARRLTNAN